MHSAPADRLSLETCRRILGADVAGSPDDQLTELRDQMYALALYAVQSWRAREDPQPALLGLPPDERLDVEERAAILEFDGRLTRRAAIHKALKTGSSEE